LLEFAALVALRLREPNLPRPFRIPGGTVVAGLLALCPAILIGLGIYDQAQQWEIKKDDWISPACALLVGAGVAVLGPVVYFSAQALRRGRARP
jgi:hypothetical protein